MMNDVRLLQKVIAPHFSEKATMQTGECRQYVFKVAKNSTKNDVKKAIELIFSVKVQSVNIVNVKGKSVRFGKNNGHHSAWKKAYVILDVDQEIDFSGA